MEESKKHVHALIAKAAKAANPVEAMNFAQAAANAATAMDRLVSIVVEK